MSNSANIPALGNKIVVDIPALNALLRQMIQAELANVTDLPVRAKQLVEGADGWEVQQFNGSSWVTLEDWNINAQKVEGFSASQSATANTIAVRDKDGALPGNLTGNAATASKAAALSAVNPVAMGGTGATTTEGARDALGVTDLLEAVNDRVDTTNSNLATTNSNLATTNSNLATTNSNLAALDAAVVHKTGDETIAGEKVFEGGVTTKSFFRINVPNFVQGELPSANKYWHLNLTDANGNRTGRLQQYINKDGSSAFRLCHNSYDNSEEIFLGCGFDKNGGSYGTAPSTPAGSTGNQIVTADYAQSMGGVSGTAKNLGNTNADDVLTPGFYYVSGSNANLPNGTNGYLHVISTTFDGSGNMRQIFWRAGGLNANDYQSYMRSRSGGTWGDWVQMMTAKGGTFTAAIKAPTPAADSNDTTVATTEWVRGKGVLVESWHSGASWYRKYSDGWIEQGGRASGSEATVTFHMPFSNTNYTIISNPIGSVWNDHIVITINALTKTTVDLEWQGDRDSASSITWHACGY